MTTAQIHRRHKSSSMSNDSRQVATSYLKSNGLYDIFQKPLTISLVRMMLRKFTDKFHLIQWSVQIILRYIATVNVFVCNHMQMVLYKIEYQTDFFS